MQAHDGNSIINEEFVYSYFIECCGMQSIHHLSSLIPAYHPNPLFSFPLILFCFPSLCSSPSCPTVFSTDPLPLSFHPLPSSFAPSSPLIYYFSPSPLTTLLLLCVMCLFNSSSLYPWRSEGWVWCWRGKGVVDG